MSIHGLNSVFSSEKMANATPMTLVKKSHDGWHVRFEHIGNAGEFGLSVYREGECPKVPQRIWIESFSSEDLQSLSTSASPDQQRLFLVDYLRKRLENAHSYELHVHEKNGELMLRFGRYGLLGGGKKTDGYLVSGTYLVAGLLLIARGVGTNRCEAVLVPVATSAAISSGARGILYTYSKEEANFKDDEFRENMKYAALGGAVTGLVGPATKGYSDWVRGAGQICSSAVANLTVSTVRLICTGQGSLSEMPKAVATDLVGGVAGLVTGGAVGQLIGKAADTANDVASFVRCFFQGGIEGGAGAGASTVAANLLSEDPEAKWNDDLASSMVIGAGLGGVSSVAQKFGKVSRTPGSEEIPPEGQAGKKQLNPKEVQTFKTLRRMFRAFANQYNEKLQNEQDPQQRRFLIRERNRCMKVARGAKATLDHMSRCPMQEPKKSGSSSSASSSESSLDFHSDAEVIGEVIGELQVALSKPVMQVGFVSNEEQALFDELAKHIVLVHAIDQETAYEHAFTDEVRLKLGDRAFILQGEQIHDEIDWRAEASLLAALDQNGVLGPHLRWDRNAFQGKFNARLSLHWSWNQLVQPNGELNTWENAKIAIIEPLSVFEDSADGKPFGIAPYDTLTLGSHRCSPRSILLIAESAYVHTADYLKTFPGKIITFNGRTSIREKIMDVISENYPEVWPCCDERGYVIGRKAKVTNGGYPDMTCIRRSDGKVIRLIQGSGEEANQRLGRAFLESPRYVGLHVGSDYYVLEDGKNRYYQTVNDFKLNHSEKRFAENKKLFESSSLFAASIAKKEDLEGLGILQCLVVYQSLLRNPKETRAHDCANWLINEALFADFISLYMAEYPDEDPLFSSLEITVLIEAPRLLFINLLENVQTFVDKANAEDLEQAFAFFEIYRGLMRESYKYWKEAKALTQETLAEHKKRHSDAADKEWENSQVLNVGQELWMKFPLPADGQFELSSGWPHSDEIHSYLQMVLRCLPKNELPELYSFLKRRADDPERIETPRARYRYKILADLVEWVLQESHYKKLSEAPSSYLFDKIPHDQEMVESYPLFGEDNTENAGDCLFDNVASQLNPRPRTDDLRRDLVDFMRKESDVYKDQADYGNGILLQGKEASQVSFQNWEGYLSAMAQPYVWGTELELSALSAYLRKPIVLFKPDQPPLFYGENWESSPIFIAHLGENHFISCRPSKGLSEETVFSMLKVGYARGKMQSYIKGRFNLGSRELISTLSLMSELKQQFQKSAGVAEGYTLGQHTERVLDVLQQDFLEHEELFAALEAVKMPMSVFTFFLAFHDIGKGKAVEQIRQPNAQRKELELRYTKEFIQEYAPQFGISPRDVKIMEALLFDDVIGDYLQTDKSPEQVIGILQRAADYAELDVENFLNLFLFFHQIDASSYPNIRKYFFEKKDPIAHVLIGGEKLPQITGYVEVYKDMIKKLKRELKADMKGEGSVQEESEKSKGKEEDSRPSLKKSFEKHVKFNQSPEPKYTPQQIEAIARQLNAMGTAAGTDVRQLVSPERVQNFIDRKGSLLVYKENPITMPSDRPYVVGCTAGMNRSQSFAAYLRMHGIEVKDIIAGQSGFCSIVQAHLMDPIYYNEDEREAFKKCFPGQEKVGQLGHDLPVVFRDTKEFDEVQQFYQNYINQMKGPINFVGFALSAPTMLDRLLARPDHSLEGFTLIVLDMPDEIEHPPRGIAPRSFEAYQRVEKIFGQKFPIA